MIDYKYNEGDILQQLKDYIDKTYGEHYSHSSGVQTVDFINGIGMLDEFCITNIIKYISRYGKKGDRDEWRKDILKVLHYSIILMYSHDEETKRFEDNLRKVFP